MRLPVILCLLLTMGLGAPSWAESDCPDEQDRTELLSKELDLSVTQIKNITAIKTKYRDQIKELRKKARAAKRELVTGLQTPERGKAHEAALKTKFLEVQRLKGEIHSLRFEMSLEIRSLLSDQQIVKFKDWQHKGHDGNGSKRNLSNPSQ